MPEAIDMTNTSKQKLVSDMKVVVSDAEEILRATAGVAGEKMVDLRERIAEAQEELVVKQQEIPQFERQRREVMAEVQHVQKERAEAHARRAALEQLQKRVQGDGKLGDWLHRHRLDHRQPLWKSLHVDAGWEDAVEAVLRERISALTADAECCDTAPVFDAVCSARRALSAMWLMLTVISSIVAAAVVSVSACRSDSAATERVTVFSESMPAFSDVAFSRTSTNSSRRLSMKRLNAVAVCPISSCVWTGNFRVRSASPLEISVSASRRPNKPLSRRASAALASAAPSTAISAPESSRTVSSDFNGARIAALSTTAQSTQSTPAIGEVTTYLASPSIANSRRTTLASADCRIAASKPGSTSPTGFSADSGLECATILPSRVARKA